MFGKIPNIPFVWFQGQDAPFNANSLRRQERIVADVCPDVQNDVTGTHPSDELRSFYMLVCS